MLQAGAILIIFFQNSPSHLSNTGNNFIKLFFLPFTSPTLSDTPLFYIKVIAKNVLCIRWPKYWSCSFSTSPSSEYSGLISLKIDWFDLLAV